MKFISGNYQSDPMFDISRTDSTRIRGLQFSAQTKAMAEEAWESGTWESVTDLLGQRWAESVLGDEASDVTLDKNYSTVLSQEELDERVKRDFYAQFITFPKEGVTDWQYDKMLAETRERMLRQNIVSRSPDTAWRGVKNFGVTLAVGVADPANIAAGYVPSVAAIFLGRTALKTTKAFQALEEFAGMSAEYVKRLDNMSAAGRFSARLRQGAIEGTPANILLEGAIAEAAGLRGEEYTNQDILISLVMGAAIDATIHGMGGALYDVATKPDRVKRLEMYEREKEAAKTIRDARARAEKELDNLKLLADNDSRMQRFVKGLEPSDQKALMDTSLVQMWKGKLINVEKLQAEIQAKLDSRRTRDQIEEDVVLELRAQENDALGIASPEGVLKGDYDKKFREARDEIRALEGELAGTNVTPRMRQGKVRAIRADLERQIVPYARGLEAELAGRAPTKRMREGKVAEIRADLEAARDRAARMNVDYVGSKLLNAIEMETKIRQMTDERFAMSRDVESTRAMLEELSTQMEDPTTSRMYVEGAEAEQSASGKRPSRDQQQSVIEQDAAEAVENAPDDYKIDSESEALVEQLDGVTTLTDDKETLRCLGAAA